MGSKHDGMIRGFSHTGDAWYAKACLDGMPYIDCINIGFYADDGDGGTTGEFAIRWVKLGGKITPSIEAFDDSWEALSHFKDLLDEMTKIDSKDVSAKEFCEILKSLGIKDLTKRNQGA